MRNRMLLIAMALVLACSTMLAPMAFADGIMQIDTTKADVDVEDVEVSADSVNLAAAIDGCAFAVGDFERASKGSNRNVADEYHGYTYYIGKKSDSLMYLVTDAMVLVYVDPDAASAAPPPFT